MPVAVLMDLDNTLIDRSAAHLRYCRQFAERHLADWPPSDKHQAVREMVERDHFGYTPRDDYFQWMADRFGRGTLGPEELWQDYQSRLPLSFSVNQAVCDLLGRLSRWYRLAIVSNGSSRNQRSKLARTGLAGLCSQVVISGEVGLEKPHPAIFQLALSSLGCEAGDALFVGDDPHGDIAGAAQVGMQTCWIRLGRSDGELSVPPTFQIETILELEEVLPG